MPYYRRAQVVCQSGPFHYTPDYWEDAGCKRWPLDPRAVQTGIFQFSAAEAFIKTYRDELTASKNVTVYTYASVVELVTTDNTQAITKVRVARPGGGDVWVTAKRFILAAGGFENARLLLISNRQQERGLGNQHDVVGRYYHDHPQGRSGYLKPHDPTLFNRSSLYDMHQIKGAPVMGYLKLSEAMLRKEKLLNINCFLFAKPDAREDQAIQSFNLLRDRKFYWKKTSDMPSVFPRISTARHAFNVARGIDYVAKMGYRAKTGQQASDYGPCQGGWSLLDNLPQRFKRIEVWHSIEQSPHPDNRVTLSSHETDIFGCPKLKLKWHWSADDIDQIQRAQAVFAKELNRAGLGTLQIENDAEGLPNLERPVGSHHLMGTTRMHENPRFGVVDANCRVHGIKNLFIAGSSTFPTGGYANPTLTIIAMALRLSDFLKQELAAEESLSRIFQRGIELHSMLM